MVNTTTETSEVTETTTEIITIMPTENGEEVITTTEVIDTTTDAGK